MVDPSIINNRNACRFYDKSLGTRVNLSVSINIYYSSLCTLHNQKGQWATAASLKTANWTSYHKQNTCKPQKLRRLLTLSHFRPEMQGNAWTALKFPDKMGYRYIYRTKKSNRCEIYKVFEKVRKFHKTELLINHMSGDTHTSDMYPSGRKYKDLLILILILKRSLYFRPEWYYNYIFLSAEL